LCVCVYLWFADLTHPSESPPHHRFYDDLQAFHAAEPQQQQQRLEQLHAAYLGPAAPSPLNIPDTMRRRFLAAYDAAAARGFDDTVAVIGALGEVKREVLALLERDNYARFKVCVI
jgi:hypothetical protein